MNNSVERSKAFLQKIWVFFIFACRLAAVIPIILEYIILVYAVAATSLMFLIVRVMNRDALIPLKNYGPSLNFLLGMIISQPHLG